MQSIIERQTMRVLLTVMLFLSKVIPYDWIKISSWIEQKIIDWKDFVSKQTNLISIFLWLWFSISNKLFSIESTLYSYRRNPKQETSLNTKKRSIGTALDTSIGIILIPNNCFLFIRASCSFLDLFIRTVWMSDNRSASLGIVWLNNSFVKLFFSQNYS